MRRQAIRLALWILWRFAGVNVRSLVNETSVSLGSAAMTIGDRAPIHRARLLNLAARFRRASNALRVGR